MIQHGQAPYLECSSRGDKRFSAFYARIRSRENRTMPWVAIIGSREPSQEQELAVAEAIEDLQPSEVCIVSGCADGIDALALLTAHNLGFVTIGIVPWPNYNTHAQSFCTHVICIDEFKDYARQEAYASVDKYHPAPDRLSQSARKLHARNYGIIRWASQVIAAPSNKPGGGGTGQGIRLAQDLNLPLTIIPAKA